MEPDLLDGAQLSTIKRKRLLFEMPPSVFGTCYVTDYKTKQKHPKTAALSGLCFGDLSVFPKEDILNLS
jgi:hypothetical protein